LSNAKTSNHMDGQRANIWRGRYADIHALDDNFTLALGTA